MSTIDEALQMLAGSGPEFGVGLSNHGPMGAEAMLALGRPEGLIGWVDAYLRRLGERPATFDRIDGTNWQEALGEFKRVSDWEDYFVRELDGQPWEDVLRAWVPRLAPGVIAGATHGLIRTAHAVRSLGQGATAERLAEFASGLAYWAARFQVLPGNPDPLAARPVSEAIGQVPLLPQSERHDAPLIFLAIKDLDPFEPFEAAPRLAGPAGDPSAFLSDLTATMAGLYLQNARQAGIPYIHTVTAPSALRMMAPHLPAEVLDSGLRYAWQACAAVHSRYHAPLAVAVAPGEDELCPDELIDRALFSGDEHAIKFTEACLREYELNPQPVFLQAAADASARYGRKVGG